MLRRLGYRCQISEISLSPSSVHSLSSHARRSAMLYPVSLLVPTQRVHNAASRNPTSKNAINRSHRSMSIACRRNRLKIPVRRRQDLRTITAVGSPIQFSPNPLFM